MGRRRNIVEAGLGKCVFGAGADEGCAVVGVLVFLPILRLKGVPAGEIFGGGGGKDDQIAYRDDLGGSVAGQSIGEIFTCDGLFGRCGGEYLRDLYNSMQRDRSPVFSAAGALLGVSGEPESGTPAGRTSRMTLLRGVQQPTKSEPSVWSP